MGPPPRSSALLDGGEAGILVPPRDQEALAAALVRVLTDDKLLAETRARSQRNIGRMSLSRVAEETLEVYRDALTAKLSAQRAPRPPLSGSRHIENMGRRRCVGSRGEPSLHAREGVPQFRWGRHSSPTARSFEHSVSAAWRLSAATRTRVQIGAAPTLRLVRTMTG
jgi:hypothetical protein